MTTGLALLFALILPNSNKKILGPTELECEYVQWNMLGDQGQSDGTETSATKGFVMTVVDPKTWLLSGILYCTYIVGTVANFFLSVVAGLGYDRTTTYGLTAPPFVLCVICMLINGFHSDRTQEWFLHAVVPLVVTLVANIIAVSSLSIGARYFAMRLLPASFYASSVVTLSWITSSLAQPPAKRAAAIAIINALCNTPNIWGSYLYFGAPRYTVAFIMCVVATALAIGFTVAMRLYLGRQNKKLDRGEDGGKNGPTAAQLAAGFRYTL
jgi:cell shape-determining protein MreD